MDGQQPARTNEAAGVTQAVKWNYNLSEAQFGVKLHLLNSGFVGTHGVITSLERARQMGIVAWCLMPARDKETEERLGLLSAAPQKTKTDWVAGISGEV